MLNVSKTRVFAFPSLQIWHEIERLHILRNAACSSLSSFSRCRSQINGWWWSQLASMDMQIAAKCNRIPGKTTFLSRTTCLLGPEVFGLHLWRPRGRLHFPLIYDWFYYHFARRMWEEYHLLVCISMALLWSLWLYRWRRNTAHGFPPQIQYCTWLPTTELELHTVTGDEAKTIISSRMTFPRYPGIHGIQRWKLWSFQEG